MAAYGLENNKDDLKPVSKIHWAGMELFIDSKSGTCARPDDLLRRNATEWITLQLERKKMMVVFPDPNAVDTASATENSNRELTDTDRLAQIGKSDSDSVAESDNELLPVDKTKAIAKEQQAVEGLDRLRPIRQLEPLIPSDMSLTVLSGQRGARTSGAKW